jgi:zinc protease
MIRKSTLILILMLTSCSTSITSYPQNAGQAKEPGAPGKPGPQASGSPFPYHIYKGQLMDNGLSFVIVPMPSDGLVSYWTIVRTGSRDEVEKGVTGFAHFFEHMMFRGSEKYPGKVYDEIVSSMGANANAFTTDDFTAYHLSFAKEDLPMVAEIEADRFQNLQYDEAQFKTESGAVYGEYRKGRTNPFEVLYEGIQDSAFDRHTYKHTTIGFEADIKDMPNQFDYSKSFFKRFYRPENVIILVTGDVNPEKTRDLLIEKYKGWKKGYQAPAIQAEPEQTAQRRIQVPFEGQTLPILAIGFKGEKFIPTDRTMLAGLLVSDLCFGESSPLYKKLVLDEQLVDQMQTDISQKRDPGLWTVFATVKDKKDLASVERDVWRSLDDMRQRPVSRERLDDVRSRWKYTFLSGLATPEQVAQVVAPLIAVAGDAQCIFDMFAVIDTITPEDVRRAVATYYTRERSTVAVLHSKDDAIPKVRAAEGNLVLLPVAQDPNVSFKVWFQVGSQDDPPGKAGLAALTAALLSEGGTTKLTYDQILARLFPLAAGYSASVDKEMTVFTGISHRDNAGTFFDLLSDALVSPGFRPDDFERLRDRAVNEIEKTLRYSSDEELGKATLYGAVYAGTPYGHLIDGSVASLKAITAADVRAFYQQYYTKENVVIGLAGSFEDSMPALVQGDLQGLPSGIPTHPPKPEPKAITGRHVTIVEKPGVSTAISFGHAIAPLRGSRDYYALQIARAWLGEHRNSFSHLYQSIREARGLNYGDYAYVEAFPGGGGRFMPPTGTGRRSQLFEVWIRPVADANALFALRAALREVESLAKNGLTKEQFETTRKFLRKYCIHYAETTADRLGYAVDDRYYDIDNHLTKFRRMIDELTLEDVNAAIRKYLNPNDLQIAIVTKDGKALAETLASDAPTPVKYAGDVKKPAEILAEDKLIERHPLRIRAEDIQVVPVGKMFENGDVGP